MSWSRIIIILLAIFANILIVYYDLKVRENSLLRKMNIHKLFNFKSIQSVSTKERNKTEFLNIEIHRVIDNLRKEYGVRENNSRKSSRRKVVLQYTAVFGRKPWPWMKSTEEFNHWHGVKCPYYSCELRFNRKERPNSNALLFHSRDMPPFDTLDFIFKRKDSRQRWIFFSNENPMNNPPSRKYDFLFNWTASYKYESDIFVPYGYYFPIQRRENVKLDAYLENKKRLLFWTSSHCGLKRDEYVRELMKYVKIDIIGSCAKELGVVSLDCPKNSKACEESLKTYKFQLSFENTFCVDYITEKYWHSLKNGIVPVVMGGANYTADVAIPGSYINIMDFSSIKALADYLMYLDKNDEAYKEYFKWQQSYMITTYSPWNCILCARLYLDTKPKVYKTLDKYWGAAENCGYTDTDKKVYRMLHQGSSHTKTSKNREPLGNTTREE